MLKSQLLEQISSYEAVIWDWNGTLLDDVHIAVQTISEILSEHDLPRLSVDEYKKVFGFPVYNYYQKLGFDFSKTPFEIIADQFIHIYGSRVSEAALFPESRDLLHHVKSSQKRQFILSAGHQRHLDEVVKHFDIHHFFDRVYGIGDHYAGSKLDRGKDLLKENNLNPKKTVMIGDTDHDHEVASLLGIKIILVADGHQSSDRLQSVGERVISRSDIQWKD